MDEGGGGRPQGGDPLWLRGWGSGRHWKGGGERGTLLLEGAGGRQGGFGREWGDPGDRYTVTGVGTEGLWRAGE